MRPLRRQRLAAVLAALVLLATGLAAGHGHFQQTAGSRAGLDAGSTGYLDLGSQQTSCPICSFSQRTSPDLCSFELEPPRATATASAVVAVSLPASHPGACRSARAPPDHLVIQA